MKIYSWNVNGLRAAAKKGFMDWLEGCEGDIVGLQETRSLPEQLTKKVREPEGWHMALSAAERKGYSGVGMYSRREPDSMVTSLGVDEYDIEGRVQLASFGTLLIANVYFPNGSGKNRDHSRVPYKLGFYQRLYDVVDEARQAGRPVLVMGDFNTCHKPIDLARPKQNRKTSGFLDVERAELDRWIEGGWVDTFRHFEQGPDIYSWWSQRFGVREKNVGWRLDMVYANDIAMKYVQGAAIHTQVKGSDHCPVSVTVDPSIVDHQA